jgi:2-polyprenyl-3-methyl-5-hydroxy-6-metoxy-1,4-benzoquinol methylase
MATSTGCAVVGIDMHAQAISTAKSTASQQLPKERAEFHIMDATEELPFPDGSFDAITCIDAINHFPERRTVVAEWSRLLKPHGRLLFTDPITVTGPLTNAEVSTRSSAGFYLFVPPGYDELNIALCGLRLVVTENVTRNMAEVAQRRYAARVSRSSSLREIEGDREYAGQQEFLEIAARIAKEGRLSRFVYVSEKPR